MGDTYIPPKQEPTHLRFDYKNEMVFDLGDLELQGESIWKIDRSWSGRYIYYSGVLEMDSGQLIPVTVEVDQNQYFCYNSITKAFVCQGYNIKEIADRFNLRFPESKLAIHNGDETAVKVLKEQMEKLYEDRNRQ